MTQDVDWSRFVGLPQVRSMGTMIFDPIWAQKVHVDLCCELMHVLKGNVDLICGRRRYRAEPGDTLLVPAGTPHRDAFDLEKGLEVFMVFFKWKPSEEYFRLVGNGVLQRMPTRRKVELSRIVERLRTDMLEDSDADRLVAGSRVLTVLTLVLREAAHQQRVTTGAVLPGPPRRRALMLSAKQFLQQHYAQHISLEDIAKALNVSAFHLSHIFSEESDFTLFHYLTTLRMEKAKELLLGGKKVSAVARAVAYEDDSYFAKTFRRHFGVSPREVRIMKPQ